MKTRNKVTGIFIEDRITSTFSPANFLLTAREVLNYQSLE
jgi:hypothetical protein